MSQVAETLRHDPGEPLVLAGEAGPLTCIGGRGELHLRSLEAQHFLAELGPGDPVFPDFGERARLVLIALEPLSFEPLASDDMPKALATWQRLLGEETRSVENAADFNTALAETLATLARSRDQAALTRLALLQTALESGSGSGGAAMAVQACAAALGMEEPRLAPSQANGQLDEVARLARVSGLSARRIRLARGWARADQGPLVIRRRGDGAILPALWERGGYRLYGEAALPDERDYERGAYNLAAPLPERLTGFGAILRLAVNGNEREIAGIALAALAMALAGLLVPLATGYLLSQAAPAGDLGLILAIGLALLFGALTTYVLAVLRGMFTSRLDGKSAMRFDAGMFDRVLRLPARFFRTFSSGDLNQRIAGFGVVRELVLGIALTAGLSALVSAVYLVLLVWYDPILALLAAGLVAIYIAIVLVARLAQLPLIRAAAELDGVLTEQAYETIGAVAKLRSAAAETRALDRWTKRYANERALDLSAARIAGWSAAASGGWQTVTLVALYLAMATLAAGELAPGQFVAFLIAFGIFQGAFVTLSIQLIELFAAQPQLERLRPLLETAPEGTQIRRDPGVLTGAIALRNVTFSYAPASPPVLVDISLDIPAGAHVAIVGASGSGKSTLLRLLLGFETPSSGAVLYDGQDLAALDLAAVRGQLGVVLQSSSLFAGSIADNIRGAHEADFERCLDAAAAAGLAEDLAGLPMGLHTAITEGAAVLSGGQRQRILIARALLAEPRIMFFDEATSALDNRSQALVSATLERLAATRITIAHRLSTVARADMICVLEQGRIVERGTYAELMSLGGAFAALARRQIKEG